MLKILTIAALSVASVTAFRQDFLDCAKHAPLIAAVAAAEAAYDAARPDGNSTIKADTQAAWSAAQAAIGASLKAAFDADAAKQSAKEDSRKNPLEAGSDKCVAGMQACVDADTDVTGQISEYYGEPVIGSVQGRAAGWTAVDAEDIYGQFSPKTSEDFDGWRQCAANTAGLKTACCESFCPMHAPDKVMLAKEAFATEVEAVKEILATKAADGTYTFECETGVTFEKLQSRTKDRGTVNVYKYITDGSECVKCGDGTCCQGIGKQIPFDATTAYAIFLQGTYDDVQVEADLINPDCKLQMGCVVSAYETCVRDQWYSCLKDKDGEFNKDQPGCRAKAVLAKCAAMKTTPTSDTSAEIAAAAKCTAANCATQAVECAADMGACAEALKALKAPPAGTPLATCIAGDAFTKCLAGTAGGKNVTQIITTLQNPKCELKNACEAKSGTQGDQVRVSACCLEAEEIAAQAVCLPKFCADQEKACKADTANVTGISAWSAPTCGAAFFQGQTAPTNIGYSGADYDAGLKFPGMIGLTPAGQAMWKCMLDNPYDDCMKDELVKLCYGYQPGFTGYGAACEGSGAATQFGSVVSLVAAVAAAMLN